MSRELFPDELDTESGELVSEMSAAVGRLRQQAAAAFTAGYPRAATDTMGSAGGLAPNDPANGWVENVKMPPSSPTIR